jgi:VWFA-related protein
VYDNGQLQKLVAFEGADDSLSCALLLDVTGSMDSFLPALKYAAMKFVDDLRDGEAVAVYSFSATLKVGQEFSSDKKLVKQAVMRTRAGGATALFDALSVVSRDTAARKGKKALIVFTDGDDNASALSAVSASRQARRSGVPIYAIAQGSALKNASLLKILEELAADTGGIAFRLDRTDKIGAVFAEISRNLRHTYSFSWTLPEDAGSTWRSIKISVAGLDSARIRAREGYWPR